MKKILFIVAHRPGRSPGQRFRFEQYLAYLKEGGFQCDISWLLNENDDKYFYRKGHYLRKFIILLKTIRIRLRDLRRAADYDVIFFYREAVMYGSVWFERRFRQKGNKLVLDFDDAIWLKAVSEGNRRLEWMKRPSKVIDIIRMCDLVITGNNYLSDFASQYNCNTVVIPTTIDTSVFEKPGRREDNRVCIGWTGSTTTLEHLKRAREILKRLYELYGERIRFVVIADKPWEPDGLPVDFVPWNRETEIKDLASIDIGIMPLPDNDWTRGKCGFKCLQYMALGIPAVVSPVGVNAEIISDGHNGFLAEGDEEWIEKLSALIEDLELRLKTGREGRKTLEEHYSCEVWKDKYLHLFNGLLSE